MDEPLAEDLDSGSADEGGFDRQDDGASSAMDQNSIDGLLGLNQFNFTETTGGVERLYDLSNVPQTRNPMLEASFERTVRSLKNSLRKIASDQVEVALNSISNTRARSYMESISLPAVLAVVKTKPWGGSFLIVVSADLVYGLVEATLGGVTKTSSSPIDGRAFTAIESRIARRLIDALVTDAEEAFSQLSPVTFELEHTETIPRFINIAPPSSVAVTINVSVQIGDMVSSLEIFMPLATLDPVREIMLANAAQENTAAKDEVWAKELRAEVMRSQAELEIVLHEEDFALSRVIDVGVGDTLLFERGPDDPLILRCNGVSIGLGRAGRSGNRLAFQVQSCAEPSS